MQTSLCHKKLFNMGKRQGGSLVGGLWPPAGDNGALWDLSPCRLWDLSLCRRRLLQHLVLPLPSLITVRQWIGTQRGSGDEEQAKMVGSRMGSRTRTSQGVPDQKSWCRIVSTENKGSDVEEVGAEGWIGEWGPLGSQIDIGRHIQTAVREDWKVQHRQLLVEQ